MDDLFKQFVSPEGTNVFVLHAYLEISEDLESLVNDIKRRFRVPIEYFDVSEEGEGRVVLVEMTLGTLQDFSANASMILQFSLERDNVDSCCLMFDGAFGGKRSLLDGAISSQTFGVVSRSLGPLLCLDSRLLQSDEWRAIIQVVHGRRL